MSRFHGLKRSLFVVPLIEEDLPIGDHPESIEQKHQRCDFKHADTIVRKFIVKRRWKPNLVGNNYSLGDPLVEEDECCQWEEHRHADSIHHGDVDYIEHGRELEMDNIVSSAVKIDVLGH